MPKEFSNIELRAICFNHALEIKESEIDESTPIFVEEVIEEANKIFQYIKTGKMPEQMEVPSSKE